MNCVTPTCARALVLYNKLYVSVRVIEKSAWYNTSTRTEKKLAAIPKHLKKHAKQSFSRSKETKSRRLTWSFQVGDLVRLKRNKDWGIVVACYSSYCDVITPHGNRTVNAGQLERIQPLSSQADETDTY